MENKKDIKEEELRIKRNNWRKASHFREIENCDTCKYSVAEIYKDSVVRICAFAKIHYKTLFLVHTSNFVCDNHEYPAIGKKAYYEEEETIRKAIKE